MITVLTIAQAMALAGKGTDKPEIGAFRQHPADGEKVNGRNLA